MAKIIPFKAVRPTRDKVSLVTSRSYDEYSPGELASQLDFNPFSFLHVLNPAYVNQQKAGLEKRFKLVAQKYRDFKEEDVFIKEEKPVFYIYEIQTKHHNFTGIIAGTALEDYRNNVIKKHEDTLQYRVELFKDYLHQTGFNTEPVLITYPENAELSAWILEKKKLDSLYEFSTTRREKHQLWKIDNQEEITWLQEKFESIGDLYIADGHHRSAAAALVGAEKAKLNPNHTGKEEYNYFMAVCFQASQLTILDYNRVVKDLNGLTSDQFLDKLTENFEVIEIDAVNVNVSGEEDGIPCYEKMSVEEAIDKFELDVLKPAALHSFLLYLDGKWYGLFAKPGTYDDSDPIGVLDVDISSRLILDEILGIKDLRSDKRIDFVGGLRGLGELKRRVDSGEMRMALALHPVTMQQIMDIADSGKIMPPKATWFEPKLRSGLIIHKLK